MTGKQTMLVWLAGIFAVAIVFGLLGLALVVRTTSMAQRNGQDDAVWTQCIASGGQVINLNCVK